MLAAVSCLAVAFSPALQPLGATQARAAPPVMLERRSLTSAAAAVAAALPAVAHADGGINGGIKSAVADALGPAADYAPYIGTAVFLAIYAAQIGGGGKGLIDGLVPKPGGGAEEAAAPPADAAAPPADDAAPPSE